MLLQQVHDCSPDQKGLDIIFTPIRQFISPLMSSFTEYVKITATLKYLQHKETSCYPFTARVKNRENNSIFGGSKIVLAYQAERRASFHGQVTRLSRHPSHTYCLPTLPVHCPTSMSWFVYTCNTWQNWRTLLLALHINHFSWHCKSFVFLNLITLIFIVRIVMIDISLDLLSLLLLGSPDHLDLLTSLVQRRKSLHW